MSSEIEPKPNPEELQSEEGTWEKKQIEEILSLNPESRGVLNELKSELKNLCDLLNSSDVQKIPFTAPGGEQSIGKQMIAFQNEKLPQIFKDTDFESSYLLTHSIQEEDASCQLASVRNILKAFGIEISEKEIAKEVGKSGKYANIWPEELAEFLQNKGADVFKIGSTLEAIEVLVRSGKIIFHLLPPKYPISHTVIISGIKINHGKIEFFINDPQYKNYAEIVSLKDITDSIIPYSFHKIAPIYAVYLKDT